MTSMQIPKGYVAVEHDDGKIHAIDFDELRNDLPLWREPVICGAATGVSSDEGGSSALYAQQITCWECIAILATGRDDTCGCCGAVVETYGGIVHTHDADTPDCEC